VRGDTHVDDPAALEGDHDERVERLEVHGDHREKVARPYLPGVVPEKGPPAASDAHGSLVDRKERPHPCAFRVVEHVVEPRHQASWVAERAAHGTLRLSHDPLCLQMK
jgi:hypothetical protein